MAQKCQLCCQSVCERSNGKRMTAKFSSTTIIHIFIGNFALGKKHTKLEIVEQNCRTAVLTTAQMIITATSSLHLTIQHGQCTTHTYIYLPHAYRQHRLRIQCHDRASAAQKSHATQARTHKLAACAHLLFAV